MEDNTNIYVNTEDTDNKRISDAIKNVTLILSDLLHELRHDLDSDIADALENEYLKKKKKDNKTY